LNYTARAWPAPLLGIAITPAADEMMSGCCWRTCSSTLMVVLVTVYALNYVDCASLPFVDIFVLGFISTPQRVLLVVFFLQAMPTWSFFYFFKISAPQKSVR